MPSNGNWSEEEAAKAIDAGEEAAREFAETLETLRAGVTGVDAVELLARTAFAMFMRIAGLGDAADKTGVEVFHVELLQALALSEARRESGERDDHGGPTQRSIDLLERNGQAYRRLWLRGIGADAAANRRAELIALLRDWTMAIRGPRHPHQTKEYVTAMAAAVDQPFRQRFGCPPAELVAAILRITERIEQRVRAHLEWMKGWMRRKTGISMIQAFLSTADAESADLIRAEVMTHRYDRKAVTTYLWWLSEQRLAPMLTLTSEELAEGVPEDSAGLVLDLLDSLSLGFGDVTGEMLEHLHLANPVRLKPLVRLGDGRYACLNPHSMNTNLADIFEEICDRQPATKARLEAARAEWLEAKLREVVGTHLPDADVHRSVRWKDADGADGESDVVAVIDKTILVFEAKSGGISAPARRGALNSLKGALKTLVVDPSAQSLRLKRHLEGSSGVVRLQSDDGELAIDADQIRDVIRVNVLLDVVGPLSAHWPQLRAAGLLPADADIAPTMSIFELETVMEVLGSQIERCHYLSRRVALERDVRYTADELDLLALYLETQFNVDERSGGEGMMIYGRSLEIAIGYASMQDGKRPRFAIRRTPLWTRLLDFLEASRPVGWTRFGHRLLNLGLDAQKEFDRLVRAGWREVGRNPDHFFTSAITGSTGGRRHTVAFAIGPRPDPAQLHANVGRAADSAFRQGGADDLLFIYWFAPSTGNAYDFMGVMRHATLPGMGPSQPAGR